MTGVLQDQGRRTLQGGGQRRGNQVRFPLNHRALRLISDGECGSRRPKNRGRQSHPRNRMIRRPLEIRRKTFRTPSQEFGGDGTPLIRLRPKPITATRMVKSRAAKPKKATTTDAANDGKSS